MPLDNRVHSGCSLGRSLMSIRSHFVTLGKLRPAVPLLMLGVGYLIPAMRVPVGMPTSNLLWILLFGSFVIVVVWLIAEIITVTDRNTPVSYLQWDDFSSLVVALSITYFA